MLQGVELAFRIGPVDHGRDLGAVQIRGAQMGGVGVVRLFRMGSA